MRLTKDDFEAWWTSPVALEVKRMLEEDLIKLAHGSMTNAMCRDQVQHAIETGRYIRTMELIKLRFEDVSGEE